MLSGHQLEPPEWARYTVPHTVTPHVEPEGIVYLGQLEVRPQRPRQIGLPENATLGDLSHEHLHDDAQLGGLRDDAGQHVRQTRGVCARNR